MERPHYIIERQVKATIEALKMTGVVIKINIESKPSINSLWEKVCQVV